MQRVSLASVCGHRPSRSTYDAGHTREAPEIGRRFVTDGTGANQLLPAILDPSSSPRSGTEGRGITDMFEKKEEKETSYEHI